MEKKTFEGICRSVAEGKIKWVDNLEEHKPGRVLSCDTEGMEVFLTDNTHEHWDPEKCKERTYGYRTVYQ